MVDILRCTFTQHKMTEYKNHEHLCTCVHSCLRSVFTSVLMNYTKFVAIVLYIDYTAATRGSKYFELGRQPHEFFNSKYSVTLWRYGQHRIEAQWNGVSCKNTSYTSGISMHRSQTMKICGGCGPNSSGVITLSLHLCSTLLCALTISHLLPSSASYFGSWSRQET